MRRCFLLLSSLVVQGAAFQSPSHLSASNPATRLYQKTIEDEDSSSNSEVSRRDAVIMGSSSLLAAALASGAPPAFAADVAKQVAELESKYGWNANSDGAPEKHIPQVTVSASGRPGAAKVQVSVPHVMDAEKPHYIMAIWLKEKKGGEVAVAKVMPATEPSPPTLTCDAPKGAVLTPMLYCNLHGLWKGESFTV